VRKPPSLQEALDDPHCGCWDECRCGVGDKALVLAAAFKALRSKMKEAHANCCPMPEGQCSIFNAAIPK
jgi:hypothetical protein